MKQFDYLVIGGGIAGLSFALKVADQGTVAVLQKKSPTDSSTSWAQGGIAAVMGEDDNFGLHVEDTLVAGAGLCNKKTVEIVVSEAPGRIADLVRYGVNFDESSQASGFDLTREGGHSRRRILHVADATGFEIQRALLEATKAHKNIQLFPHTNVIDIITTDKIKAKGFSANTALGVYALMPDHTVEAFQAKTTLIATGGAGKVYLYTSNPDVATGDGIAMCYRAGVAVANMEFFQFHPTCLYHPEAKSFLLTEALRGEGAKLRRVNGELFMHKYHERGELAPRDIVARAIDNEMKMHGEDYVLLDITHKDPAFVKERFPTVYETCKKFGFDLTAQPVPVVPAAHYCCGGVVVDERGRTNIANLYVAGEAACTGLHGANRLASNSLIEGIVFGTRAAEDAISVPKVTTSVEPPPWNTGSAVDSDEQVVIAHLWDEIRRYMWNYVGIVRSNKRLERALRRSHLIETEINEYYWNFLLTSDLLELRNLSVVSNLVIRSAIARKESRGLHYNVDYPKSNDALAVDTVLSGSV